jgi:hypothetical protein
VVVRDAVEPGGERQPALDVAVQLLVDLDENVLGQILDHLVGAIEPAAKEAVHQRGVLLVQRRERHLIALLRLAHQLCHCCLHRSVPLFPVSRVLVGRPLPSELSVLGQSPCWTQCGMVTVSRALGRSETASGVRQDFLTCSARS